MCLCLYRREWSTEIAVSSWMPKTTENLKKIWSLFWLLAWQTCQTRRTRGRRKFYFMIFYVIFAEHQNRYSLLLSDTVKIGQNGAVVLTEGCTRLSDVVMDMEVSEIWINLKHIWSGPYQEEEEEDVKPQIDKKPKINNSPKKPRSSTVGGRVLNAKTRGANREQATQTTAEKIKTNQQRLHAQLNADGVKRWEADAGGKNGAQQKVVKRYESYRREEQLPRAVEDRRIYVDEQRQSVVLPINGYAVPYHISTIKNVTKTEESNHMVLRINFQSPGQIAGKKEDMVSSDLCSFAAMYWWAPAIWGPRCQLYSISLLPFSRSATHVESLRSHYGPQEGCCQERDWKEGTCRCHWARKVDWSQRPSSLCPQERISSSGTWRQKNWR